MGFCFDQPASSRLSFPARIGISIVEENRPVRLALSHRLAHYKDIDLISIRPYLPTRADDLIFERPNVVLLGFPQVSVTNPTTTFSQIREMVENNISVIGLTPYIDINEEKAFLEAGGIDFLLKTIDSDHIVNTIRKATSGKRD